MKVGNNHKYFHCLNVCPTYLKNKGLQLFKIVRPFLYFNIKSKNYSTAMVNSGIKYLNEANGFVILTNKFIQQILKFVHILC